MMNFFKKNKDSQSDLASNRSLATTGAATGATSLAIPKVDIVDTTTQTTYTVTGFALTGINGEMELPTETRKSIVATSSGQIFYDRNERDNAEVQSKVSQLKINIGDIQEVHEVDERTISEIYRMTGLKEQRQAERRNSDISRMQAEMISIVAAAARQKATDIHIIVNQEIATIQYRINKVLRPVAEIPVQNAFEMLAATFALADESDTSYQIRAQQGARLSALTAPLPPGIQALRLQFLPLASDGRFLVIRLLYSGDGKITQLRELGYNNRQIRLIEIMKARPVGMNIISGPTGSGKSTTLKSVLETLIAERNNSINVLTVEDPPEYIILNAKQTAVTNAKTQEERRAAFVDAINAALRADPNVLMIGEIRDRAAADLAIEGALTGHPVYASLHTNTAMEIPLRLRNMEIEDYKIYNKNILCGLIGQRLLGKLCVHCRLTYEEAKEQKIITKLFHDRVQKMREVSPVEMRDNPLYFASTEGCPHCKNLAYSGMQAVPEIILPDDQFMELLRTNQNSKAHEYWLTDMEGIDLLGVAWLLALKGVVSPLDVEREVMILIPEEYHKTCLENWKNADEEEEDTF